MAYWYDVSKKFNSRGRKAFLIDKDADVDMLPTTKAEGVSQHGENVMNQPVKAGSIAKSIATGNRFMLNSVDEWVLLK